MSPMPEKQNVEETGMGVTAERAPAAVGQERSPADASRKRQEALLDEALNETFPASDPVSVAVVRESQG